MMNPYQAPKSQPPANTRAGLVPDYNLDKLLNVLLAMVWTSVGFLLGTLACMHYYMHYFQLLPR